MESVSITDSRLPDRIEAGKGGGAFPYLDIEFDESAGALRIYDPRLFQAGRRDFCKRLLKAASRQPGIIKAEVELASASCQIEFSPGSQSALCVADSFARAVREASAGSSLLDSIWWWRRRGRWSALTAFRLPSGVSLWETFEVDPAQIRLRHREVPGNRARLSRLADALAALDGVAACRVSAWSNRITIDVYRDGPLSDRFLDTVEQALSCLEAVDLLRPQCPTPAPPFMEAITKVAVARAAGARHLIDLALATGDFSITLVGLVVPGFRRSLSCWRPGICSRTGVIE